MIVIGVASVQTWECDSNGHWNIQFYVARLNDAVTALALPLGLGPRFLRENGLRLLATDQHVRFHKELRPGAALTLTGGIVAVAAEGLTVYQEIRQSVSGALSATATTSLALVDASTRASARLPAGVGEKASPLMTTVPEEGAVRGVASGPPRPAPSWDEAERLGLLFTYQGPVAAADCDANGFMEPRACMARISDSVPNLIARSRGRSHSEKGMGGAALEYRYALLGKPRAGDLLAIRPGLKAVGGKTVTWAHWIIDRETGAAVATVEGVTVVLDLATRRAVALEGEARAKLERLIVPGISL